MRRARSIAGTPSRTPAPRRAKCCSVNRRKPYAGPEGAGKPGPKQKPPVRRPGVFHFNAISADADYRLVATLLKVVFRLVPRVVTALMMTTATRAAIRPYSMAVTPDSSRKSFARVFMVDVSWREVDGTRSV